MRVVAPDGFIAVPELVDAVGPRAPWLVMSIAGQPAKNLNRAGRNFTNALSATPPGGLPPDRYWPAYGAQATMAALSAIARSNGTREGVRKALFSTRLQTAFGPITFDRNGDIEHAPFTLLRLTPGGAGMSDTGPDFADGTEPWRWFGRRTGFKSPVCGRGLEASGADRLEDPVEPFRRAGIRSREAPDRSAP